MKKTWILGLIAMQWMLPSHLASHGQLPGSRNAAPGLGVDFSLEYVDAYLFRGQVRDTEPGYNMDFTIGAGKVTYSYFTHQQTGTGEFDFEEHNHSIEMTWVSVGMVQTTGYRYYDYNSLFPDTQEFYYKMAYQSPWHPTFGTFLDIDAYKGYYFDLSLDRMFPLSQKSLAGLKLYVAGADGLDEESDRAGTIYEYGYFGDNGLTNGYAKLYWKWFPTRRWSIEAAYRFYLAFDDDLDENPITKEYDNVVSFKMRYAFP